MPDLVWAGPLSSLSPVATACLPKLSPPNHQLKYKNTPSPPSAYTLKIISLFRNVQRSNTMGIRENLSLSCKNRSDYDKSSYQQIFCHRGHSSRGSCTGFVSSSLICVATGSYLYYYSLGSPLSPLSSACLNQLTTNIAGNTGLHSSWSDNAVWYFNILPRERESAIILIHQKALKFNKSFIEKCQNQLFEN